MAKEIEKYFVKRLQTYLLEYLNDFSQNNVAKFSLGISSNIRLENLSIKKQALLNFSLPMYIIDGKISSITVNMPLNYKSQQSEMIIEGIDLTVCAISEISVQSWSKDRKGDETLKKQKLKIWEEQMIKYFEQLSPPNWIQKIVDGIYNNMSITVKSFNLKFQNNTIFGTETVLRIKADFSMKATDCNFHQKFNSDLKNSYKQIEIKKLSISLRGHNFKQQSKKEEQYILYPIDIMAKLIINKDNEQTQTPLKDISIKVESPIIFQINKDWKNYLLKLNELFKNLEIIQDNYHLRPLCDVKSNYDQWWKYLINAIIQNQKNHKLDLGLSSRRLVLMKRYIELYKRKQNIIIVPWLSTWTLQDEQKFQQCEKLLSLKDLLKYREWAFQEIRIEARRYFHSSKDGQHKQSVKPILEIWTNTINNQNSFKDHQKKLDDIPIELEDDEKINLYEILERDKTQVLISFLKGQNNNPDQVKLKLSLEIHSIFLLLIENRVQSQIIYSPNNTQIFKLCQCSLCYSKKVITRKSSESSRKSKRVQADKSSIYDVVAEQKLQNKDDDVSFHTAKAMDSFTSDLRDLNEDRQFLSESIENEPQNKNNQQKQNMETQKNQKIILMISLIGVCCQLEIYQDNRLKTQAQNPFIITDIRILSLGMIPTLLAEKQDKISQAVPKDIEQAKNLMKKRFSEFISEIFEITIQNQQVFLNSEACFLNLIEFLSQNEMQNIAAFLIEFEKDKNCFQDFSSKNYEQYDSFFNETDEDFFIHMTIDQLQRTKWSQLKHTLQTAKKEESNKSWKQYQSSANKHQYIQELHGRIVELIKKKLFVQFLEEYGDQILPLCIQYMKDKFGTHQQNQTILNKIAHLKLSVQLDGSKAEFEIKQTGDKNKGNLNNTIFEQQPNPQPISQYQYKVDILPFQFFLTTKSIASLLDFMENSNVNQLSQSQLFITQNQKLLECILKSKPLSSDLRKQTTKFSIQVHEKFKIRVLSDQIANITKTELQLQIEQLQAETTDIEKLLQNIRNSESLNKQHKYYSAFVLRISRIFITHKYYAPDLNNSKEELRENQNQLEEQSAGKNRQSVQFSNKEVKKVILSTSLVLLVLNSLIENHALLTDQKIYLQIPYFKLELSDSLVCFTELITILMKQRDHEEHQPQEFIMSSDSLLRAELISLYTDHTHEECKHCILKYKKSIRIVNVLFGAINPEQMNNIEYQSIWFNVLEKLIIQHQENKGLMISFVNVNRYQQQASNQTMIWIPIVVFTKDLGYFKDLNTIHCSSSTVLKNGIDKFSNIESPSQQKDEINYILIQPSYEVNPVEVWRKLDDKFIFYGRKLENELFTTNFDINQEQEFDREIHSSEFKTPNQDKLYLLAYYFSPLRKNLILEQEKEVKEKNMKIKLYFQLQKIWARFIDQFAACTVLTTLKNLSYIGMIVSNIYNLMYQENIKIKEQKISFDKQNPIEMLEDMMISIYVQSLYYASNQSFFRLNSMRIMFHLELLNEDSVVQSEVFYKRNSNSLGNASDIHFMPLRNRNTIMNSRNYEQNAFSDGESIMKCAAFIFNFNKVTVVDVKLINIKKKSKNEITFSIDNISITISPLDKQKKEILLNMPDKDKSNQSKQIVAIKMNVHFYNSNPQIDIKVESSKIQLSQQTVKDLLIAVNSFYLINIQEQVALVKFLRTQIFKEQLFSKQKEMLPYDLYKRISNITENKNSNFVINYTINLFMESLKITLQELDKKQEYKNFFNFEFLVIELVKKRGQDILLTISEIKLEPQSEGLNLNLIQQCQQLQKMTFKMEGRVIFIENIKFIMISKFMNELKSFKKKIDSILQQSREELYQYDQLKVNQQLKIDECDQELIESIPFKIVLRHSQVKIPEKSTSDNFIEFYFSNCEILLEKVKKEIYIPKLNNYGEKDDRVIDYDEENETGIVFLDKAKISLKNVRSWYQIKNKPEGQRQFDHIDEKQPKLQELFDATEIDLLMLIPYHYSTQNEWVMKDQMEIILKELNMKLDLGKMLLIKGYFDTNLQEESDFFNFEKKGLEKITISLRIDTLKAEKCVYAQKQKQKYEQEHQNKMPKLKQQFTQSIDNQHRRKFPNMHNDHSPLKQDSF